MQPTETIDLEKTLKDANLTAFFDGKQNSSNSDFRSQFLINDANKGIKVLSTLEAELQNCKAFDISVAFVTLGGIEPLLMTLSELERKSVPGRILTTDYLCFSDPKALKKLNAFTNIEVRLFRSLENGGFHTKGYIFHRDNHDRIIIGSSNLTQAALTTNQEWNTKIVSLTQGEFPTQVKEEFDSLWSRALPLDEVIAQYEKEYADYQKAHQDIEKVVPVIHIKPNQMQEDFIVRLRELYDQGAERALLISATGTGKTYASALGLRDGLQCSGKVLFLAHRQRILNQARQAYQAVFDSQKSFNLLVGGEKDIQKIKNTDFLFSMTTMMSKEDVIKQFNPHDFDVIICDEVHHASSSLQKIVDYFSPKFVLGMTATPDRTDDFDVYKLFHNNIAYEIRLKQAMEHNFLCPFHYFGITDIAFEEEPSKLVDVHDLGRIFNRLVDDHRVDYIIEKINLYGYSGKRVKGLMFCSSIHEAEVLSEKFNKKGLRTIALTGKDSDAQREDAILRLTDDSRADSLDYILTRDIFNVGVDIPEVNQVVMLRPTESNIIFIQQLGRGLRKYKDKEFVVILDFIGNYTNNYMIPIALSGDRTRRTDTVREYVREGDKVIKGESTIHFDEIAKKRIYAAIDKMTTPKAFLEQQYQQIKKRFGRAPTFTEFYRDGDIDPILFVEYKSTNKNLYRSYYSFIHNVDTECGLKNFSEEQNQTLEFISTQLCNGCRLHELLMLRQLHHSGNLDEASLKHDFVRLCNKVYRHEDYESALRVLQKSFLNTQADEEKFKKVNFWDTAFLEKADTSKNPDQIFRDAALSSNAQFHLAVEDLIDYGITRYFDLFNNSDADNLVLYQKYSRRDVCRLLNWPQDEASTMYGYRIKYETCPIFVTYDKSSDIASSTAYLDQFINEEQFSWFTRNKVRVSSSESQKIINQKTTKLRIYLFVKKSDDEGSDFYYLGQMKYDNHVETTIKGKKGLLPIVNFRFKLLHPVKNDLYDYLTS